MLSRLERINQRYFHNTPEVPEGEIMHEGNCYYYSNCVCTCGLLHDLFWVKGDPNNVYAKYGEEYAEMMNTFSKLNVLQREVKERDSGEEQQSD